MKYQPLNSVIELSYSWELDSNYDGFFPKGARDKTLFFSPPECELFLKPNHRYLFKESWERYPNQFWSEIVAYKIGALLNINVPPAFVATWVEPMTGELLCGALIEWFYEDNSANFLAYRDAGEFLEVYREGFDRKLGTEHNFIDNITILATAEELKDKYIIQPDWLFEFISMFLFDIIIGNTDRHQDNWGVLFEKAEEKRLSLTLSPAYDNGTSLGFEIVRKKFVHFKEPYRRATYINKGRHHVRFELGEERLGHFEFLSRLLEALPMTFDFVESFFLSIDMLKIVNSIEELTKFSVPTPLSHERAEFMVDLTHDRVKTALDVLAIYKKR